jgi:hypothetical protein
MCAPMIGGKWIASIAFASKLYVYRSHTICCGDHAEQCPRMQRTLMHKVIAANK